MNMSGPVPHELIRQLPPRPREGQVSEELQRQLDFLRRHLRHPGA